MGNFVLDELKRRCPVMKTISLPRWRHPLHIMPTSTGYDIRKDSSYAWDGRRRGRTPFTVLQHSISGAGNLRFGRRQYRIGAGETLLVTIPHDHRYWVEDGGDWEFFWIAMNGQEALRIHRNIILAAGPVLKLRQATIEHLADCSLRLIDCLNESPGAVSAIAYEALMALHDDVFGSHASSGAEADSMRRVVDHILSNLGAPLTIADLAEISGFSRAHFSRMFAVSEGMPPAEFVLRERMRAAAKLLVANERIPIKEVSVLGGFTDSNYFAKAFRRIYGVSPTEFRTTGMYTSSSLPRAQ